MKFNPQTYKPIDYRQWILGDQARQGVNIQRLQTLNQQEQKVFDTSIPYQDARNDPGHAELTAYFAKFLLPFYPNTIPEIVVPTAIVHDNGWAGEDPGAWERLVQEKQKQGKLHELDDPKFRKQHQDQGAPLALKLFKKANYPPEQYHQKCAEIILDHDTRLKPTTPSGKLVRDADYLWRVTLPCNEIYLFSKGILDPKEVLKRAEEGCLNVKPSKKLEDVAQQIARIELVNTLHYKFPDQAIPTLQQHYPKELAIIKKFYQSNPL